MAVVNQLTCPPPEKKKNNPKPTCTELAIGHDGKNEAGKGRVTMWTGQLRQGKKGCGSQCTVEEQLVSSENGHGWAWG